MSFSLLLQALSSLFGGRFFVQVWGVPRASGSGFLCEYRGLHKHAKASGGFSIFQYGTGK